MSGQSGGSQNQGAQGGQPQSGQPAGGQPQGRPPQGGGTAQGNGNDAEVRAAKTGVLTFLVAGFGMYIIYAFVNLFGDDTDAAFFTGSDEALFVAAQSTLGSLVEVSILLAVGLAIYFYSTASYREPAHKTTVIAVAAGAAVIAILMLLFGIIFEPDMADISIGDEIAGLLGYLIGVAVVGALAGFVLEEDPAEILD